MHQGDRLGRRGIRFIKGRGNICYFLYILLANYNNMGIQIRLVCMHSFPVGRNTSSLSLEFIPGGTKHYLPQPTFVWSASYTQNQKTSPDSCRFLSLLSASFAHLHFLYVNMTLSCNGYIRLFSLLGVSHL